MKIKSCLLLSVSAFLLLAAKAQTSNGASAFRVAGYYSLQSAMTGDLKNVPFNKVTHINLYFLNPDSSGNFTHDFSTLIPFIQTAHTKNVKVLASIAGGGKHPYYAKLLKDNKRAMLINNLLSIVLQFDLDGIDVDIEGSDIDENYDNFAIELAASLHQHKKLITAAIAVFYKGDFTDKALAQYDFVNVMSYDHTGAWAPGKPGPHSTYAQAVEDLAYFKIIRGIPKEKLTLGVPFYGYGFGPTLTTPGITMNYGEIVSQFPGAESADQLDMPGGKVLYYNGIPTIKMKTILAKEEASGIMIWQLSGDAPGTKSLLQAIDEVIKENK
jgi:GH18 family chitinase